MFQTLKLLLKGFLLVAVIVLAYSWISLRLADAPIASKTAAFDPQKAFDDGMAMETLWNKAKVPGGAYPPDPAVVDRVNRALADIPSDWPKSAQAVALLARLRAEQPAIVRAYSVAQKNLAARFDSYRETDLLDQRRDIAKVVETSFLDGGKDVYVSAEGKEFRTLRIKYALMSRPWIHAIQKHAIMETWRKAGFRELIFTDGYRDTWTLKLN